MNIFQLTQSRKLIVIGVAIVIAIVAFFAYTQFFVTSLVVQEEKGRTAFNAGSFPEAILEYEKGLQENPDDSKLLLGVILSYASKGNRTGTESEVVVQIKEYVDRVLSVAGDDRDVLLAVGYVAEIDERYLEALDYYSKAIEVDPSHAISWFHLGHVYEFLGDYKLSQQMYDKAFELDPNDPSILISKGREALFNGDQDIAFEFFLNAADNAKDNGLKAEAYAVASSIRSNQGLLEDAKGFATLAVIMDQSYAPGLVAFGMSLSFEGKPQEAVGYMEAAMKANPRMTYPYLTMGIVLRVADELDQAITFLLSGLDKIENDNTLVGPSAKRAVRSSMLYEIGKTYSINKDNEQALTFLEQSVELNPEMSIFLTSDFQKYGFFSELADNQDFQALLQ